MLKKILLGLGLLLAAAIIVPYVWIGMDDKPFDDAARAKAPGEFAQLSNGKLHYVWVEPAAEAANGETVVMLHGLYVPHFMFAQNAKALAGAGYRVLLPDHFGHGFSDRPAGKYDAAFFAAEIEELLAKLDIDEAGISCRTIDRRPYRGAIYSCSSKAGQATDVDRSGGYQDAR